MNTVELTTLPNSSQKFPGDYMTIRYIWTHHRTSGLKTQECEKQLLGGVWLKINNSGSEQQRENLPERKTISVRLAREVGGAAGRNPAPEYTWLVGSFRGATRGAGPLLMFWMWAVNQKFMAQLSNTPLWTWRAEAKLSKSDRFAVFIFEMFRRQNCKRHFVM